MSRIKAGDTEALRELIEAHQHRVIGTVAKMLGDAQKAYDAYQQSRGELVILADVKKDLLRVHTAMAQSLVSVLVGLGISRERAMSAADSWFKHLRESRFATGTAPELAKAAAPAQSAA